MAGEILTDRIMRTARGAAMVVLLGGGVTACASSQAHYPLADLGASSGPSSSGERLRGTDKPYQVNGQWYYPKADPTYDEVGMASWYGYPFQSRHTADGEVFDQTMISAAHKTLPLPCIVEVTNLQNGRTLRVRVNDRGPFVDGRVIDLSKAGAEQLGFDKQGVTRVRVRYVSAAQPLAAPGIMQASYRSPPAIGPGPAGSSADGFDDIEQSDARGHVRPDAAPIYRSPPAPESGATPIYSPPANDAQIATTSLPTLSSPLTEANGAYAVQAGAFASRPAADHAAARLASAGAPQVSEIQHNGATLYRVTVGAFADPDAAAETRARVIASGFSDARVVPSF